jgi:hypothetical protein
MMIHTSLVVLIIIFHIIVAAQMYEKLVTRKIPQIVWAESGSYLLQF